MGSPGLWLTGAIECGNLRFIQHKFGSDNIKLTRTFHIQRRDVPWLLGGLSVGGMGL